MNSKRTSTDVAEQDLKPWELSRSAGKPSVIPHFTRGRKVADGLLLSRPMTAAEVKERKDYFSRIDHRTLWNMPEPVDAIS